MVKSLRLINIVLILFVLVIAMEADTPPGIAKNPSHARCLIKKYKHCYNLEHVCPKFCPDSCTVECVSCKPICSGGSTPLPPEGGKDDDKGNGKSPPSSKGDDKGDDDGNGNGNGNGDGNGGGDDDGKGHENAPPTPETPPTPTSSPPTRPSPPTPMPSPPPTPTPTPLPPPPTPSLPTPTAVPPMPTPSPPTPTPSPTTPTPSPPTPTPSPPTPTPSPSPSPPTQTPTPPTPTPSPPTQTPSPPYPTPSPPSQTPSPPTTTPPSSPTPTPYPPSSSPPPDSSLGNAAKRRRCKNRKFPQCFGVEHVCPSSCPNTCEVDCNTCKPVCKCDYPGAVCQDPRFIGGDGITFYFHGKKDKDFCLVTDPNLHINAHFIGKRNDNMKRDFTWVQSIGILFSNHHLFVGAKKTATWDDANDRLAVAFDGAPIYLPEAEGENWQSETTPTTTVKRDIDTNSMIIKIEGIVKITAKAVPITAQESRVHNYGIANEDCFAHLELGFKFYSLSDNVNGVLGQTYRGDYVSRVKMGVSMPGLGGDTEFTVSSLHATDCAVSQFSNGGNNQVSAFNLELPSMNCGGGMDGRGVVCKK